MASAAFNVLSVAYGLPIAARTARRTRGRSVAGSVASTNQKSKESGG